jgi:hypothetical protein
LGGGGGGSGITNIASGLYTAIPGNGGSGVVIIKWS